jgi:17beta-estradiol 17-dehydrogenase / very-long-chain 3-oxoacyl-CoA reductase
MLEKYGPYAVVTGGSDGVGKHYVQQLHQQGFKVIIISRTMEKMKALQEEMPSIEIIQHDFTNPDFDAIEEQLKNKDIGLLVNNVGINNFVN